MSGKLVSIVWYIGLARTWPWIGYFHVQISELIALEQAAHSLSCDQNPANTTALLSLRSQKNRLFWTFSTDWSFTSPMTISAPQHGPFEASGLAPRCFMDLSVWNCRKRPDHKPVLICQSQYTRFFSEYSRNLTVAWQSSFGQHSSAWGKKTCQGFNKIRTLNDAYIFPFVQESRRSWPAAHVTKVPWCSGYHARLWI